MMDLEEEGDIERGQSVVSPKEGRDDVEVDVLGTPRAARRAEVDADIEALRLHHCAKQLLRMNA